MRQEFLDWLVETFENCDMESVNEAFWDAMDANGQAVVRITNGSLEVLGANSRGASA